MELVIARFGRQLHDFFLDIGHTETFCISYHRYGKPPRGGYGDGNIAKVVIHQFLAIDIGIHRGPFLQGETGSFGKKAHKAKSHTVRFLEFILVFVAGVHHRLHVHLVERGEHGCRILCFHQPAGNRFAQVANALTFFGAAKQFDAPVYGRDCSARPAHRLL